MISPHSHRAGSGFQLESGSGGGTGSRGSDNLSSFRGYLLGSCILHDEYVNRPGDDVVVLLLSLKNLPRVQGPEGIDAVVLVVRLTPLERGLGPEPVVLGLVLLVVG
jgi:hypothetical protein